MGVNADDDPDITWKRHRFSAASFRPQAEVTDTRRGPLKCVGIIRYACVMLSSMSAASMLDREVYLYAEVDRLVGLNAGTARRWINGYRRSGRSYDPILRESARDTEWVTWGELVETRILAEYREQDVPTPRLRAAVDSLRQLYRVRYPLAYLRPYLTVQYRDLTMPAEVADIDAFEPRRPYDETAADESRMVVRTRQMLLGAPGKSVIDHATLADDDAGEKFVAELTPDLEFPGIIISPGRFSGQPTFVGRRVSVATIAGMALNGDRPEDLAADYGLSLAQVHAAINYAEKHRLAAA